MRMKIGELRDNYDRGEVDVVGLERPQSGDHIHSPTLLKDHYRNDYVSAMPLEELVWEVELDEKIHFLVGSTDECKLLAKNVMCQVEER